VTTRNMLIWDAGFVMAVSKNVANGAMDLKKLKHYLESRYGKFNRFYFLTSLNTDEQRGFHTWLQRDLKADVVIKSTKVKRCGHCGSENIVEKGVDVAIVTLAIKFASQYDRLVLCNGDGDLVDAIKHVRDDLGKQVIIAGDLPSVSGDLLVNSDEFVDLSEPELVQKLLKS